MFANLEYDFVYELAVYSIDKLFCLIIVIIVDLFCMHNYRNKLFKAFLFLRLKLRSIEKGVIVCCTLIIVVFQDKVEL